MSILSKSVCLNSLSISGILKTQTFFKIIVSKSQKLKFCKLSSPKNLHIIFTFKSLDKSKIYFIKLIFSLLYQLNSFNILAKSSAVAFVSFIALWNQEISIL